jgi:hypothetical protein
MIYPLSLYNFGKVCKDSSLAGDVLRALCKQEVTLSSEAQVIFDMISNDNGWMDERIAAKRSAAAERQRRCRENRKEKEEDVTLCHAMSHTKDVTSGDSRESRPLPSVTSVPSSLPSSNSKTNSIRSVTVPGSDDDGTVALKKEAKKFIQGLKNDSSGYEIYNPEVSPVVVCAALTGDYDSHRRWRQCIGILGEEAVREECYTFYLEIRAGEEPANRGAALNARFKKLGVK